MMTNKNEDTETTGKLEVNSPHDKTVQKFLQEIDTAKSLFREYLPGKITDLLDLDSLEYMKEKFVDETLSKYYSDFLYKVNFKNKIDGFIFLLLEHKSWPARYTALQALKYMVHVWDLYLANHDKAKYLPPVIPLVLYHGKSKWNLGTHFSKLFNEPGPLKAFIPDFKYLLLDISHKSDKDIKGIPILQILLMTLKYIFKPTIKNKLPEIIQLFKEIKNKNTALDYLVTLINYLVSTAGNLDNEEIEITVSKEFSEGGEIMATIAEKIIDKTKWDVVMNMLREGASIDFISKVTGFTADQIKEFKEKIQEQKETAAA
ncbi:MAG: Rpn family recombination-promoting nuclease/putative transposase [Candidatus Aminicenantes bacterium]|nr:MAG: Rpn family recombination-promoting nuclease/putative transposase [Candidatus Aminicenantes bacterium]